MGVRRSTKLLNAGAFISPTLLTALAGGLGWHFSSVLLRPDTAVFFPEELLTVREGLASFVRSPFTAQPGRWAVRWADGAGAVQRGVVGPPLPDGLARDGRARVGPVRRMWVEGPVPPDGAQVVFDAGLYDPDPSAHGLAFIEVPVDTALGECPAWFVPPPAEDDAATWVITVHGRGADRRECLRVLPLLHRMGFPVLAITYRNDVEAPASPDGHYHLGDTEWEDLEAAVEYAYAAGAQRVVLYGWSMGAAIIGAYLDRAKRASEVVGAVVWDCPLLDWKATLRQQAALRRLPPGLTVLASTVTRRRIGIDFKRFDLPRRHPAVRPPTLLFHGAADTAVPAGPARALAVSAPDAGWALRYIEVAEAEHTATWNADPPSYERALADFLRPHRPS
jgi:alpha-beta hydrolase superfamily lysophospholipase